MTIVLMVPETIECIMEWNGLMTKMLWIVSPKEKERKCVSINEVLELFVIRIK